MKKVNGVEIEGTIFADQGDLGHNEFTEAFIKFIEGKGWYFGGRSFQIGEDGNKIEDIDWAYNKLSELFETAHFNMVSIITLLFL